MRSVIRLACLALVLAVPDPPAPPAPPHAASCAFVAHRGASHLAPENTLAAFRLAWELGADAVEGDFHLTRDGAIVAHHDETTKKTAGVDRPIRDQTLAELKALDVGRWKDPRWVGERIPTLAEVLAGVPAGRKILIEIKTDAGIVPALLRAVRTSGLRRDQMIVIAFDEKVIARVERKMPVLKTYWLAEFEEDESGRWRPTAEELVATARRIRADGVDVDANLDVLDESFMRALRDAKLEVHVWTINEPELARRLIDLGVDSITTDRPGWLREQLGFVNRSASMPRD